MSRPIAILGRGLAALLTIVGAVAGPPAALVRFVGNPFPRSVPPAGELVEALTRRGVSDEVVVNVLAILAWLIWTQVVLAVATEIVAHLRSLPAPAMPVLPGLQPLAGNLVAAVVLLAALTQPRPTLETGGALRLEPEPISLFVDSATIDDAVPDQRPIDASEAVQTETYVVQRHDSFWSIAEDLLGDGMRWREIRDLNVGRRQADGHEITASSDVIHVGWQLQVPKVPAAAGRSELSTTHTVERGEHLWQIAEDNLEAGLEREASNAEIDPYWRSVIEENRNTLVNPDNPSLIFAGQVFDLPAGPEVVDDESPLPPPASSVPSIEDDPEPDDVQAETTIPSSQAPTTTSTTTVAQPNGRHQPSEGNLDGLDGDRDEADTIVLPGLLGVAGTGVAAAVALQMLRRRRDQQARAPIGSIVPATPDDLVEIHREVAGRADSDLVGDVAVAMQELARHRAGRRPRIVQAGHDHIDVLVDVPDPSPPDGWTSAAGGEVWTRPRPVEAVSAGESPAPLLVSIGSPEPGIELCYDLESAGLTVASGPTESVDDLVRSVVLEVVHGPSDVEVVLVGDVPNCEDDQVRVASQWDDVADDVLSWARLSVDALRGSPSGSAFAARATDQSIDGVVPLLLVLRGIPDEPRFQAFLDCCAEGGAAAALVLDEVPALVGTNIHLAPGGASIPSLGLDFEPQQINAEAGEEIEALVESADRSAEPADDVLDLAEGEEASVEADVSSNGHGYVDPDHDVLVRVLGQVDVEGGGRPLKPKQLAVLTFIATHPGCSPEQLEEALWPEPIETSRHRLHIALSQVRSALGADQLPNMDEAAGYRVAETVRTDVELFERRVACAKVQSPDQATELLRGALELVTGPPFTYRARGRQSFTWIDTEHWMSKTEAMVVKAAWDMWRLCSDAGDCDGAIWAAHQGLLASPTNTELTNCLMQAHVARGDRSAAETVYRSHLRALDQLDLGDPEESTIDIWEREVQQRSSLGR